MIFKINNIFISLFLLLQVFLATPAHAQSYPAKTVKIIVPWPAGGATDSLARLISTRLSEAMNQSFVIENKSGASGFIGTDYVAKSTPDGYTLLFITASTHAISPNLFKNLPYDAIKDFSPIAGVAIGSMLLVSPTNAPFNNVPELIAFAKSKPSELNYATYGNGTTPHLAAELFMQATGIKMTHIPYRGTGPASMAVTSGEVSVYFDAITSAMPQIQSGKLKAIAYTGLQRSQLVPEIPAIAEFYPGFELSVWYGLEAPAGTPRTILDKLNFQVNRILSTQDVVEKLQSLGLMPLILKPDDFGKHIAQQKAKWADVVKRANIPFNE
jgi:tripartite-type tricarboxylate transporter receptor subunit TctC